MSIVSGLKWNSAGQIIIQTITFIGSIALARLLSPDDFGTVAMITVISNFSGILLDAGFSTALIQKKNITRHLTASVFWLNFSLSILFALLLIGFAPAISKFYDEPLLIKLCYIISLTFILGSLAQIPRVLLTRQMDFKTISLGRIYASIFAYSIAIFMAYYGFGIWSLVAQIMIGSTFIPVYFWLRTRWIPTLEFSFSSIKGISSFSLNTFFNSMLEYWAQNLDALLIGRKFGSVDMGIYNRSFSSVLLPVRTIATSINGVLFPKYSQLQDDKLRFQKLYLKTLRLQAFFVFPLMGALSLLSEPIILLLFGEQWSAMIPIVRLFSLLGILSTTFAANDTSVSALGRADLLFRIGLIEKGILIGGTLVGLKYGIIGLAYAKVCAALIISIPKYWLFTHVTKITLKTQLSQYTKIAFSTLITLLCIWLGEEILEASQLLIKVPILLITGSIIYISCTWLLKESTIIDLSKRIRP